MNYKEKLVEWGVPFVSAGVVLALGLFTVGCGGGGTDSTTATSASGSGTAVSTITVSAVRLDLSGIWKTACYGGGAGGVDRQEELVFNGSTVDYKSTDYTSTDLSCTGTATSGKSYTATIAVKTDAAITGWVDGGRNATTAPTAQDASGALSTTAAYTPLNYTFTAVSASLGAAVGDVSASGYVIDDTATTVFLYRFEGTTATTADPFKK